MKKHLAAAVLVVVTLALSGCGGGGGDSASSGPSKDEKTAAAAISDSIVKGQKSGDASSQFLDMDKSDADCIGTGLVDKVGLDSLKKYGLVTKDNKTKDSIGSVTMSASDAKAATGVLFGCTDVPGMMQKALSASGSIPKAMQNCVNKVLTEDTLRGMFTKIFSGKQDEAQQALVAPMTKCATGSAG